jgi:hypothetical protein
VVTKVQLTLTGLLAHGASSRRSRCGRWLRL